MLRYILIIPVIAILIGYLIVAAAAGVIIGALVYLLTSAADWALTVAFLGMVAAAVAIAFVEWS